MTNFIWNNGTELVPVPLTNSLAKKLASIINNLSITKNISGTVCYIEDIDLEDDIVIRQNLNVIKLYEDADELKNVPVTVTRDGNDITITSTADLFAFKCPQGITGSNGEFTITENYVPSTDQLDFITFRMGSGRNFPIGGIPVNLSSLIISNDDSSSSDSESDDEHDSLLSIFTSNPVIVSKFEKYPELKSIFFRHPDICDFLYLENTEEIVKLFTTTETIINSYASSGSFERLKTYLKTGLNFYFIKLVNQIPTYYTNILVDTGWSNLAIYKGNAIIDNSIPRMDLSIYDLNTIFRGNVSGYSGQNSLNPIVDGTINNKFVISSIYSSEISTEDAGNNVADDKFLAHISCSTATADSVTEIEDDNGLLNANSTVFNIFTNATLL